MKQFTVNEYGKDTWIMKDFGPIVRCGTSKSLVDYSEHTHYFHELFEVIGEFIDDIELSLNITHESCNMTLYLKDDQMAFVEDIAFALEDAFPDNIESVYVLGNELCFEDCLFEFCPSEQVPPVSVYNPILLMTADLSEEVAGVSEALLNMKSNIMNFSE